MRNEPWFGIAAKDDGLPALNGSLSVLAPVCCLLPLDISSTLKYGDSDSP
jgi:hypothetical protein